MEHIILIRFEIPCVAQTAEIYPHPPLCNSKTQEKRNSYSKRGEGPKDRQPYLFTPEDFNGHEKV